METREPVLDRTTGVSIYGVEVIVHVRVFVAIGFRYEK